jgi:hypothetical protein
LKGITAADFVLLLLPGACDTDRRPAEPANIRGPLLTAGIDDEISTLKPKEGFAMADRVRKVNYCYTKVSNRPGQGVKVLEQIKDAGIDMVAFSGFPVGKGKAQLDFVTPDTTELRRLAKKNGWRLSKMKKGFLVWGQDKEGAVHRHIKKLADNKISVTAADAVTAGKGRYGMILWVSPKNYARAARTLKAK